MIRTILCVVALILAFTAAPAAESPVRFGLTAVVVREDLQLYDRWSFYLSKRVGRPVQFVGHSLGGAIAAIAAEELATERPKTFRGLGRRPHVATICSPLNPRHKRDGAHPRLLPLAALALRDMPALEASLVRLNDPVHRKIRIATVASRGDALIYPRGATVPGASRLVLRDATHFSAQFHPTLIEHLSQVLSGSAPR